MIGRSTTTLIPSDRHNEDTEILAQIRRGDRIDNYETVRQRRDGTLVDISLTVSPVKDAEGKVVGASKIARDIIERKRSELALAERDTQLALAEKTALVGSYVFDLNTGRVQISAGYAAIYGLPEGTEEYGVDEWRVRVHPDDLARLDGLRSEVFAEQRSEFISEYRIHRLGGEIRWIESRALISYNVNGRAERMVGVNIDVTERKRVEEQQRVLVSELDHRVKNALATISAVISQTSEASRSWTDFAAALEGRIKSMGSTHELLSSSRWSGISLAEIIRRELAPYATSKNTEISGSEIMLTAAAGQATAMVIHELVTNAAKHGALSTPKGRVLVHWNRQPNENPRAHLVVEWQEIDGPSVVASSRSGYGTSMIRELIPYELGGRIDFALAREGVRCRMEIPDDCLSAESRRAHGETFGASVRR
jgi:PAS domain S-box-containing protein